MKKCFLSTHHIHLACCIWWGDDGVHCGPPHPQSELWSTSTFLGGERACPRSRDDVLSGSPGSRVVQTESPLTLVGSLAVHTKRPKTANPYKPISTLLHITILTSKYLKYENYAIVFQ